MKKTINFDKYFKQKLGKDFVVNDCKEFLGCDLEEVEKEKPKPDSSPETIAEERKRIAREWLKNYT